MSFLADHLQQALNKKDRYYKRMVEEVEERTRLAEEQKRQGERLRHQQQEERMTTALRGRTNIGQDADSRAEGIKRVEERQRMFEAEKYKEWLNRRR